MLGSMYALGQSVSRSPERAASLYQQSCGMGFVRACGMLGESYITGDGVPRDMTKARQILVSELALAEKTNEDKAEAILDEVLAS